MDAGGSERERQDREETPRADADGVETAKGLVPSEDFKRRRRARSIALAVVLAALVAIFYAVTLVRRGGNVLDRPL